MNKKFPSSFSVTIDLENIEKELYVYSQNSDLDEYEKVESKILKIPYVEEVSFNHQSWLVADLETDNPVTALKRLEAIHKKLEKILNWYEMKNKAKN